MTTPKHILVLAGTGEARALCGLLAACSGYRVTASLAGVTGNPQPYPVAVRTGGFGGSEGLADWLKAEDVALVVDATHPFATSISANAARAAGEEGCPIVRLVRLPWRPGSDDNWTSVADLEGAVAALPRGARAFFATGSATARQVMELAQVAGIWAAIRTIEPVDFAVPLKSGAILQEHPPADVDTETDTFLRHGITHLVTRNSGGASGLAKLQAARFLGLPVVMIERPPLAAGIDTVETPEEAVFWIRHRLGG